ncbi:hypothetical protein SDC9_155371 [bioreactor metagenome]|uniref:Uncharacterized protein n=1 Tax=bioreactor metagenome TaxID=1076179 RepID=A0A645F657_9ZZZZ
MADHLNQGASGTDPVLGKAHIVSAARGMQPPGQIDPDQVTQILFDHKKHVFICRAVGDSAVITRLQLLQAPRDHCPILTRQEPLAHKHQQMRKGQLKKYVEVMIPLAGIDRAENGLGKSRRREFDTLRRLYLLLELG